jgi:hypothetical protein
VPRRLHDRPVLAALAGALAISFSGILFRAAHVSPTPARCTAAAALPVLWPSWLGTGSGAAPLRQRAGLAGRRPVRARPDRLALESSRSAPLATVLGNLQVVPSGCSRGHPGRAAVNRSLAAVPVALFGVLLISGVLEAAPTGEPGLGVTTGS